MTVPTAFSNGMAKRDARGVGGPKNEYQPKFARPSHPSRLRTGCSGLVAAVADGGRSTGLNDRLISASTREHFIHAAVNVMT